VGVCALIKNRLLNWAAGATLVLGALLSACQDPGPGPAPTNAAPAGVSGSGNVTLSWEAPTSNTDGTPLSDLSGYRIYYGSNPAELSESIPVNVGIQTYVVDDLHSGTWYFAVVAVTSEGTESSLSNIVAETIT
jgi:hypothetical protein